MHEVNLSGVGLGGLNRALSRERAEREQQSASDVSRREEDTLEVSSAANSALEQIDQQHVSRVRAEIEAGSYLTDERIDGAVDRLLAALAE